MARPGRQSVPLGILLVDEASGSLTLRLRETAEFEDLEEQETDILDLLEKDLEVRAREAGGAALVASLEDSLSDFFRISDRTATAYTGDPQKAADRLFDEHVDPQVHPFMTHLPLFSLRAAATRFGDSMHGGQEGWVRTPGHLALHESMFVAMVTGRSMEPLIPDGSLCIFRAGVAGTRQGKHLLIEQFGETDFASRYTVKRYTSRKRASGGEQVEWEAEGEWEHERIRLEPLNKEFAAFNLGPDEFRVIAEFVAVL